MFCGLKGELFMRLNKLKNFRFFDDFRIYNIFYDYDFLKEWFL